MCPDDDEEKVTIHRGDKVITVKQRFDIIERKLFFTQVGVAILLILQLRDLDPFIGWIISKL